MNQHKYRWTKATCRNAIISCIVTLLSALITVGAKAMIWFIEIVWQATEPWRTRSSVFPMIWAWAYSFPLRNTHPHSSMCTTPRMSNSAGQLNNNIHTVFTHLGLHFQTGGMEALKTIQIWAGNHTEFHLQLTQQPWWLGSATAVWRFISVLTERKEQDWYRVLV